MDFATQQLFALEALIFVLGLCTGSFLNVVALRSLSEESFVTPPSKCPICKHRLSPLDNIPVFSYLMLRGKCRYCRAPISWQYPAVEFGTACVFVAITHVFLTFNDHPFLKSNFPLAHDPLDSSAQPLMIWWYIAGALFFACTLIAVTVTDFREKLIPHEITYPAMIVGIIFSTVVRHDFFGAMTGIGASYLLFDFIAFYGLKWYIWFHGGTPDEPIRERRLRRRLKPRRRRKLNRSLRWRLDLATIEHRREEQEPLEVMGGGDAVLSAVMSAFLGWQLLVMALMIGFIAGSVMGLVLLIREMVKAKLLHNLVRSCLIWSTAGATVLGGLGYLLLRLLSSGEESIELSGVATFAGLGAISGLLIGILKVGTSVSKPYPFGPALALGGLVAIFFLPNWLY
jgi:prepilin signal peptidase PulO-like enzyme (type II secretory pathway)